MNKLITGVAAGIVVFIWGMLSWMVLPWHQQSFSEFRGGKVAAQSVLLTTPESGMYAYPTWNTPPDEAIKQPKLLAVVSRDKKNMLFCMAKGLLIQIFAGLIITCIVATVKLQSVKDKMILIFKIALFASVTGVLPNWLWWSFTPHYTLLAVADILVGWMLAGLIIAKRV
ncbi:MAG: hypothetical protein KC649_03645 [Candidatus Omnitrophica bacterium]|nr:hypothetical protein [Candidatus Omnitrophota bacterium]